MQASNKQRDIIIYTSTFCPYCHKAIKLLESKGAAFTNMNVSKHRAEFDAIMAQTGWDTVPQIFIGSKFIGGCDDMHALERAGELDKLIWEE